MASVISLLVQARDATGRGLARAERSINRFIRGVERGLARTIGGALSDGIAGGLRTAMTNPVVGAAAVALGLGIASMLGAALAGVLVLAIGGAFIGLGAAFAAQSDVIQRNWKTATKNMGEDMKRASEPLVPAMHRAIHKMEEIVAEFAPRFQEALAKAVPHVETFMDRIISGFRKLGGTAAEPLEEAFNVLLDALGPDMEDMLAGLGDALGALARTVRDNSSQISMAVTGIIGLITTAVDIVNFFANAWVWAIDNVSASIGRILQAVGFMVDGILAAFETVLGGLDKFAGAIPGIGDKFGKAKEAVGQFREDFRQSMDVVSQRAFNVGKDMDTINKERILRVNKESWENQLSIARASLKKTTDQKARAKLTADIAELEHKVKRARQQLAALNGMTATMWIKVVGSVPNLPRGKQWGRAMGGVVGGAATGGARNNMTLVGERGPELVNLGAGAHVRTNSDSRRMMSQGGGGGMEPFAIYLDLGGERIAELLIDPTRKIVQRRGGVAATFGKL